LVLDCKGVGVHSLYGASFFVASLVHCLPEVIGPLGANGANLYLWNDGEMRCVSRAASNPSIELQRPDYSVRVRR
jgi:hypothetical protein